MNKNDITEAIKNGLEISKEIKKAIKYLIYLRRPDIEPLLDGDVLYEKASQLVEMVINDFEPFYEYAYEGYQKGIHTSYDIAVYACNIAKEYNLMLDLCEPEAFVSDDLVDKYIGYYRTINDLEDFFNNLK